MGRGRPVTTVAEEAVFEVRSVDVPGWLLAEYAEQLLGVVCAFHCPAKQLQIEMRALRREREERERKEAAYVGMAKTGPGGAGRLDAIGAVYSGA